tara:strand:- start:2756 stop:3397 length:642 start_codon:yes stop_codon:yes gene_type:complete
MASGYSRIVTVNGTAATAQCVELPTPPRGTLDRIVVTQTSGVAGVGDITIYNRKGACSVANDIHVAESGTISTVADNGGVALVTTAADHNLIAGNTFEVKGCSQAAYNVTHTVTAVVSPTVVVTDVTFTVGGTGGLWQTSPYIPTSNPASHLIYSGSLAAGSLQAFDIDRGYENRDNESETMRSRNTALWAEFTPATTATYEIAITCEADQII